MANALTESKSALIAKLAAELGLEVVEIKVKRIPRKSMEGLPQVAEPEMVERTNLMTGQKYMEPANTPLCCSPASETFWSM